jgi:hypothetical protein
MFFACANNEEDSEPGAIESFNEEDSEPGAIESFTEKTADEITTSIKTPINKARSAKNTGQDRMKDLDEMVKE